MNTYQQIAAVNASGTAAKVRGVLFDTFTASMVVQVHDALSAETEAVVR